MCTPGKADFGTKSLESNLTNSRKVKNKPSPSGQVFAHVHKGPRVFPVVLLITVETVKKICFLEQA